MMARLTRNNLMLDAAKLRELANRRGTSESEAAREAIDHALAAAAVMAAIAAIHTAGGIADVFGKLPADWDEVAAEEVGAGRSSRVGGAWM